MSRSSSPILAVALLLLGAACASNSFGHRDPNCDPDERLSELLHRYEDCKRGRCEDDTPHVLVDCDRAENDLERLALDFPRHVPTLMANAAVAYDAHSQAKAQSYLSSLFAIQKAHPEAAVLRSRIAIEQGNLPGARRFLDSQVEYTPDHAGLREAQSAVLYMAGDLVEARTALDAAHALGAPPWRVAFNRGLIAEAAGEMKVAQAQYEAALAENPEFPAARSRLAGARARAQTAASPSPAGKAGGP